MERDEILKKLDNLFADVLDEGPVNLSYETTAKEVDGWDSLTHVELVVAMENEFGIVFKAAEVQSWKNVGQMIDSIQSKM